jgi:hypothetical protein
MRIIIAFLILGLSPCPRASRAEGSKANKGEGAKAGAASMDKDYLRASRAKDQAKQAWIVAEAESDEKGAAVGRLVSTTGEEKAAWDQVAKAAAKEASAAREARAAWELLERVQLGAGEKGTAAGDEPDLATLSAALREGEAKETAAAKARAEWERAEERASKLEVATGAPLREWLAQERTKEAGPAAARSNSWWCATNFLNHSDQVCRQAKEECEALHTLTMDYVDCREVEAVSILEATLVNRGRVRFAFPLPSQCETARRKLLRNRLDYRAVGRCHSSAVSAP